MLSLSEIKLTDFNREFGVKQKEVVKCYLKNYQPSFELVQDKESGCRKLD